MEYSSTLQYDCKVEIERVFDYVSTKETRLMHFQFNPFVYEWELIGEDTLDIEGHWYLQGQWSTNRQGESIYFSLESQDMQIANAYETFSGLWKYGDDEERFFVELPIPRPNYMPFGRAYIESDFNNRVRISINIMATKIWCWDTSWNYFGDSEVFPDQLKSYPETLQETGVIDMTARSGAEDYQNTADGIVSTEDAAVQTHVSAEFNFFAVTDEELIQKYSNLITQILRSNDNVDEAEVLVSDNAYIYYPEYDDSRCWNTIDLVQINGQWLFEQGLYLSAVGFEDRVIIYLCTNAGSSDIGWIYDWNGEIIRDYNGQTLPDYIMDSVYGNSSVSTNSSVDRLGLAVEAFLDCISTGNRDGVKSILPPRMDEIAAMEGISKEEAVEQFLAMLLEDCPIWGDSIKSYHTEKLSVESAETLGDTDLFDFYSVKNAGISIVNTVTEQSANCWIVTLWMPLDDTWYLMGAYWYDSLDAIPIAVLQ